MSPLLEAPWCEPLGHSVYRLNTRSLPDSARQGKLASASHVARNPRLRFVHEGLLSGALSRPRPESASPGPSQHKSLLSPNLIENSPAQHVSQAGASEPVSGGDGPGVSLAGVRLAGGGEGLPPPLGLARPSGVGPSVGASLGRAASWGGQWLTSTPNRSNVTPQETNASFSNP